MKSVRTQRKPASAIIFTSPGFGSMKWTLTPRDSSTVGELDVGIQQPAHSVDRLSAEMTRERKSATMASTERNFIIRTTCGSGWLTFANALPLIRINRPLPQAVLTY